METCGVITLVQEHRFELKDDAGVHAHFTLSRGAPLGWHELQALMASGTRIAVCHGEAAPGHTTAAADAIYGPSDALHNTGTPL